MAYLLQNGSTTNNLSVYLRDVLFLNFESLPTEIPFNTRLGLRRFILEESILDYMDRVREAVTDLLNRLNDRHASNMTMTDITNRNNEQLTITIELEDLGREDFTIPILI